MLNVTHFKEEQQYERNPWLSIKNFTRNYGTRIFIHLLKIIQEEFSISKFPFNLIQFTINFEVIFINSLIFNSRLIE